MPVLNTSPGIVLCTSQGTPEWHAARRGKITASMARIAIGRKGTKGRSDYIEKLVMDFEGTPNHADEETEPWFAAGKYFESWARGWYSWNFSRDVVQTGFIVHTEYSWLGFSPDGLIGEEGLLEIKFRHSLGTFHKWASIGASSPVLAQIQTGLYVTGRKWCDYVNYWRSDDHDKEKGRCWRIERDDNYIENTLLPGFISLWADVQKELATRRVRL